MNDFKWLAVGAGVVAILCWLISAPDRRAVRHWWRRRDNGRNGRDGGRDTPWGKLTLAFIPLLLLGVAAALWYYGLRTPSY